MKASEAEFQNLEGKIGQHVRQTSFWLLEFIFPVTAEKKTFNTILWMPVYLTTDSTNLCENLHKFNKHHHENLTNCNTEYISLI